MPFAPSCTACGDKFTALGRPLTAVLFAAKTSAGCPAISRHNVRKGDPATRWRSAICLIVSL
uniref:Uncharacterized protein n=1 Tax=Rhizophora mucronata TaxID=61149 RepID=A0A2P2ILB1_RHIMU